MRLGEGEEGEMAGLEAVVAPVQPDSWYSLVFRGSRENGRGLSNGAVELALIENERGDIGR